MQALFSPEILQAVEVKGLREEPTLPEIENINAQSISQDHLADRLYGPQGNAKNEEKRARFVDL